MLSSPLIIYPMLLFMMALLALLSGIGIVWRMRRKQAGIFTTFVWSVFSGSIGIGFMTFAMFIYQTQHNIGLALGVAIMGIVAIVLATRLALR